MPITPNHWGGCTWISIHVTCYYIDALFSKNIERQKMLHAWMRLRAFLLACGACEQHFLQFMKQFPMPEPKEYNPADTVYLRWSIRAHNNVRRRQHKSEADEEEVVAAYKSGTIYGLDKYIVGLDWEKSALSKSDGDSMQSTSIEDATAPYKLLYILGAVLGFIVLGAMGFYSACCEKQTTNTRTTLFE